LQLARTLFLILCHCFPLASLRSRLRSLRCMISGKSATLMARIKACQEAITERI
jgi:hypothetical protein